MHYHWHNQKEAYSRCIASHLGHFSKGQICSTESFSGPIQKISLFESLLIYFFSRLSLHCGGNFQMIHPTMQSTKNLRLLWHQINTCITLKNIEQQTSLSLVRKNGEWWCNVLVLTLHINEHRWWVTSTSVVCKAIVFSSLISAGVSDIQQLSINDLTSIKNLPKNSWGRSPSGHFAFFCHMCTFLDCYL